MASTQKKRIGLERPSGRTPSGASRAKRTPAIESAQPLRLVIPALRCHMGRWTYYAAGMRLRDVAERIKLAEDIHDSSSLNELIQRALSKRADEITEYLVTQKNDRFFNAIVVGVYGGEPEWFDLRVEENPILDPNEIPEYVTESLGILRLSGTEQLFAIDGQHRVVGIRQAVRKDDTLGDEQITALFIAHQKTQEGLERTRRLFTTLNRYAKPVSKKDVIALDEDDTVAIVTRRLVDAHPLFHDKVSVSHTKSIPVNSRDQFTTIVAVYDSLDTYLRANARAKPREWTKFKRYRRPDREINENFKAALMLFAGVIDRFPEVAEMSNSLPGTDIAGRYRSREGGHLLFRPIGLSILTDTIAVFLSEEVSVNQALDRIARVPMTLSEAPWLGLLWDSTNRRMITRSENRRAATRVLYYGAGGDLRRMNTTEAAVGGELAGLLGLVDDVKLHRY
jgi:DNA sulfur modification protein DndB